MTPSNQLDELYADGQAIINEIMEALHAGHIPPPESLRDELIANGKAISKLKEQIDGPLQ